MTAFRPCKMDPSGLSKLMLALGSEISDKRSHRCWSAATANRLTIYRIATVSTAFWGFIGRDSVVMLKPASFKTAVKKTSIEINISFDVSSDGPESYCAEYAASLGFPAV